MKIQKRKQQGGFIVTIELLIITTILVLGLITGWAALRDSILAELSDLSESIGSLNQGYAIASVINSANSASTAGSMFTDSQDHDNLGNGTIDMNAGGDSNTEYTYGAPVVSEHTASPAL
jgi:hypothetical protein